MENLDQAALAESIEPKETVEEARKEAKMMYGLILMTTSILGGLGAVEAYRAGKEAGIEEQSRPSTGAESTAKKFAPTVEEGLEKIEKLWQVSRPQALEIADLAAYSSDFHKFFVNNPDIAARASELAQQEIKLGFEEKK